VVETATIDLDSTRRMWLPADTSSTIEVRYSDASVQCWSQTDHLATAFAGDICVGSLWPGSPTVGAWSNQATQRFGFRTHQDAMTPPLVRRRSASLGFRRGSRIGYGR